MIVSRFLCFAVICISVKLQAKVLIKGKCSVNFNVFNKINSRVKRFYSSLKPILCKRPSTQSVFKETVKKGRHSIFGVTNLATNLKIQRIPWLLIFAEVSLKCKERKGEKRPKYNAGTVNAMLVQFYEAIMKREERRKLKFCKRKGHNTFVSSNCVHLKDEVLRCMQYGLVKTHQVNHSLTAQPACSISE